MLRTTFFTVIVVAETKYIMRNDACALTWSVKYYRFNHCTSALKYPEPEDRIFNRFLSDISVLIKKITLSISDSIETGSPVESEIVRVFFLSTTGITEITRFTKPIIRVGYLNKQIMVLLKA